MTTAASLEVSRPWLLSYLAEDVDGVSSLEGQLIGMLSSTIPQALEVVGVVCALVHCCKGKNRRSFKNRI